MRLSIFGGASRAKSELLSTSPGKSSLVADSSLTFDCIGFNVMGDQIMSTDLGSNGNQAAVESRLNELWGNPGGAFCATYPGVTSSPILRSELTRGASVARDLVVPVGSRRIFQAIGIVRNSAAKVCTTGVPIGSVTEDLDAEYYDLGRAYVDYLGASSAAISIDDQYSQAANKSARRVDNCGGGLDPAAVPDHIQLAVASSISGDDCVRIDGQFLSSTGQRAATSQNVTLNLSVSGIQGTFHAPDQGCAGPPISQAIENAGISQFTVYFSPTKGGTSAEFTVSEQNGVISPGIARSTYGFSACSTAVTLASKTDETHGTYVDPGEFLAQPFQVTDTVALQSFSLRGYYSGGNMPSAQLSLHSDNGNAPGDLVGSAVCPGVTVPAAIGNVTCDLGSAGQVILQPGRYWIKIAVTGLYSVNVNGHNVSSGLDARISSDNTAWSNSVSWDVANPGPAAYSASGCTK